MDATDERNNNKRKSEAMEMTKVSLASELQDLLAPLMGGEPLDLSLLASINLTKSGNLDVREETAMAHAAADHLALFEKHIGPYQDVLDNAAKHAKNLWRDVLFCFQTGCDPVNEERYTYPRLGGRVVKGPYPDPCVWVGLFLGRDEEERMREEIKESRESGDIVAYQSLMRATVDRPKLHLSVLELARNILQYLREEANRLPDATNMLRFCALYGLSGAIDDVLSGKYGSSASLTIDSVLPFKEHDAPKDEEDRFDLFRFGERRIFMPAWAFGAALGYPNVVRHSIQTLGAKTDMNLVMKMKKTGEMRESDSLPGLMLHWAIKTNQPEMVKCLVSDYGFQFRWISDQFERLFELLFHIDATGDEFGAWRGPRYNPHEHMFDRRSQRTYRASCCYKEKQKMLQAMIEVGLPFQLFIPQINVEVERNMMKFMQDNGYEDGAERSVLKDFFDSLSRLEGKARCFIFDAGAAFNMIQDDESETLTLIDFYERLVDMWKNQATVQDSRLIEFEKLDPRWKKYEEKGEEAFAAWWGRKSEYGSDSEDVEYGSDSEDDW